MTTIYLIRHSAYENPRQILHGRLPGFPLSPEGKKMAKRLARFLAKKPIRAVYTSRLTRARETAQIVARTFHLRVGIDPRLLDIKTPLQGKPQAYIQAIDSDFYRPEFIKRGGERLREVFGRTDRFLREKAKKHAGESIVVVSHGDPIMSVGTRYSGKRLPRKYTLKKWYVPMASGFKIVFDAAGHPKKISRLPKFTT
ncbi:MAG: Phosphoglycerate mutase [Candidatus Gottesmanbacteria bacterium GW2011_GWB1_49_7]|uniref:Phosphoglycerate mutase n=1 Tax=Candidatus Gottesmanbacteria bacterium GW2011_GWB1_49_7 TaxID=1618448 RepID=A0A0G1VYK3_9BACT|nr:MAG: Phosphoglycerate mutase [Candidatus Gottesmanbacteria bacterium GW2011_GWB1_49_7]